MPINTRLRTDDVAYVLEQSDSTTLIVERYGLVDCLGMVRELQFLHVTPTMSRLPNLQ